MMVGLESKVGLIDRVGKRIERSLSIAVLEIGRNCMQGCSSGDCQIPRQLIRPGNDGSSRKDHF